MSQEVLPAVLRHDTAGSAANRVRTLYIYVCHESLCIGAKQYASTVNLCVMIIFLSGE
jgi:hypothetical protein